MGELMIGLAKYFILYNGERPHQALGNKTPEVVYRTAIGGGAIILDKYPRAEKETETATSGKAPILELKAEIKEKAKPGQRRPAASEVEYNLN